MTPLTSRSASFSAAERDAMKTRAKELKAEQRATKKRDDGERQLLDAVNDLPAADKKLATDIHALVTSAAPELWPKTWYGMPAYANADGKVVCFLQVRSKFDARYATFGFNEHANLDDGDMWPTSFALANLTPAVRTQLTELITRAIR